LALKLGLSSFSGELPPTVAEEAEDVLVVCSPTWRAGRRNGAGAQPGLATGSRARASTGAVLLAVHSSAAASTACHHVLPPDGRCDGGGAQTSENTPSLSRGKEQAGDGSQAEECLGRGYSCSACAHVPKRERMACAVEAAPRPRALPALPPRCEAHANGRQMRV